MATLDIIKSTQGYFTFVLNGNQIEGIVDNAPNLTTFGNICHFKTKNGASLFKNQNILYSDVTYTDTSSVEFTFANVGLLWQKLISEEFFKGLNQTSGSGASRFDDLTDTFEYFGNDGKVPVVDASQLKLVPVEFFNYNEFTQLDDVAISNLVVDKILSVELVGGVPKIVLSDKPQTTQQLVNAMGWLDYNDLATSTTPLTLVSNVNKKLTNDTLGAFTDRSQAPFGVNNVWSEISNQFNFTQLTIGDTLDIRVDINVATTSVNQRVRLFLRLAVGSPSQYDLPIADILYKTATTYQIVETQNIYIGSSDFKDYPAELYVVTDSNGTCVVNGWYTRIFRKSVNLVEFSIDEDFNADHYRGEWNALTNTPSLVNGFGQKGDYYLVTVAGGGYSINDIVSYNGVVWYKKVDNNQGLDTSNYYTKAEVYNKTETYNKTEVYSKLETYNKTEVYNKTETYTKAEVDAKAGFTPIYREITSNLLTTQDEAGIVAYLNAVTPVIVVDSKSILKVIVTDTGSVYEVKLNNRSFGVGETAITKADVLAMFTDVSVNEKSFASWMASGIGSTAINVINGNVLVATGTLSIISMGLDTKLNSIPFVRATSATTAGSSCGWKENSNFNTSLIQGFDYSFIYSAGNTTASCRGFVGLYGSTAAIPNVNPSSFTLPHVGLGHDTSDTNLFIIHNDNVGTSTKVNLGVNFPSNDPTKVYLLRLISQPVTNSINAVIYWKVEELISGIVATGTITTDLPRNTSTGVSSLVHAVWRNNGANTTAAVIDFSKIFLKRLL